MSSSSSSSSVVTSESLNTRELIECVKNRPLLWDFKSEDYKNRIMRDTAWNEIALIMIDDFANRHQREQTLIVKIISQKWRNIRDAWSKAEKKSTTGEPKDILKRYLYADYMTFLDGIPRLPPRRPGLSETTTTKSSCMMRESRKRATHAEARNNTLIKRSNPQQSHTSTPAPHAPAVMAMTMGIPDEDESFFNSLLPSVRKLDDDQKLEFRVEVMRILKDIKLESSVSMNSLPMPEFIPYDDEDPLDIKVAF